MRESLAIHWFRQDLRLADNPALRKAAEHERVLPIFILDTVNAGEFAVGAASRWWLHRSLLSLAGSLGNKLSLYAGDPLSILDELCARFSVEAVYWNRCYEPWRIHQATKIKEYLKEQGVAVQSFNASLLWEPWTVQKKDGSPYKVFTPFYNKGCLDSRPPRPPLPLPEGAHYTRDPKSISIDELKLLPQATEAQWHKKLEQHWTVGEAGAQQRLQNFIREGLHAYKGGRDLPAKPFVSRLSPHLHFGEISPNTVWQAMQEIAEHRTSNADHPHNAHKQPIDHKPIDRRNIENFCSELGWREFSYSQLYHNPELPRKNLQSKFDAFPWTDNAEHLRAWQKGQTGVPMVDAGMRELWQTGYMHNRVRMICASYLVKNLLIHWWHGERWFWDTLVDADLANNSASWQWVAGCGADAAPYFRIFNPVIQGIKFDTNGDYVRTYIPEIASLPNKYLFSPWEAPATVLQEAGITLGTTYPTPLVDLKESREAALAAYNGLKAQTA